eukprot:scaffold9834_cov105-Isochrysis_galbana.AAC.3
MEGLIAPPVRPEPESSRHIQDPSIKSCWLLDARRRRMRDDSRRASSRICSPCFEWVRGAVSGQNGAECDAEH